jgi:hypothetical protein
MWSKLEVARFLMKRERELIEFLTGRAEREVNEPAPEPAPKPAPHTKFKPGSQEWFRSLPPAPDAEQLRQRAIADVKAGRAVSDRGPKIVVRWPRKPSDCW